MEIALYHQRERQDPDRPLFFGKQSANDGFLAAYLRQADTGHHYCYSVSQADFDHFAGKVRALRPDLQMQWLSPENQQRLSEPGLLYVPSPHIAGRIAWGRHRLGDTSYSLCGITHSISPHAVMDTLQNLLLDPVRPWDALVCTSQTAQKSIETVIEGFREHLTSELGATRFSQPQLPIIPLGVDCDKLACRPSARARVRQELGLSENDILVLYCGRLSYFDKAHPLAMYQALDLAAERSDKSVHLIEAGRFPNAAAKRLHKAAARLACRAVKHRFLADLDVEAYNDLWSAADIFCSFADNFQETFGLTPLEAMAMGVPVVVSDWDGYRDTVRNGIDGFCVPTLTPSPGSGQDLADRYADRTDSFSRYSGYTSQMVAIDVPAGARAFEALIRSSDLRRRFGAAGQLRAREYFDWSVVMEQYRCLWADLKARREAARNDPSGRSGETRPHPGRLCPFRTFETYVTVTMKPDAIVSLVPGDVSGRLEAFSKLDLVSFVKAVMPSDGEFQRIIDHMARTGSIPAGEVYRLFPQDRRSVVERGMVWLYKLNIIQIVVP